MLSVTHVTFDFLLTWGELFPISHTHEITRMTADSETTHPPEKKSSSSWVGILVVLLCAAVAPMNFTLRRVEDRLVRIESELKDLEARLVNSDMKLSEVNSKVQTSLRTKSSEVQLPPQSDPSEQDGSR